MPPPSFLSCALWAQGARVFFFFHPLAQTRSIMLMTRIFRFAQRSVPKMSSTERIALRSGTAGIERAAFAGDMSLDTFKKYAPHPLTATDKRMLAKAPSLLSEVDEATILRQRVTPPDHPFWSHAKREGFFGLIVPDKYGGNHMSNTGLSKLLQALSSCSASVPVHIMVPASLGPAELLVHYGTAEQRERFLPRLARGAIPCFGLTSADAGSDAAGSMVDVGRVVDTADGRGPKILLNCAKRYITLAPMADIVGIAFKLEDADGVMERACGRPVHGEITLALVERGRVGLTLGPYSDPLGVGFVNGTVEARDIELSPAEDVIGGLDGVGHGWKFLMEALAAGRGIALPAGAAGSSKMLVCGVAGYAAIRKQFKLPLSAFEGVQEKLVDMALRTYEIDSMVAIMNSALDDGERPPVLSAILKQRTTELGRDVVMHAMDIVAGAAICMGPRNFVAPAYLSSPIGITVEGSNTMTRSLLIFGQGIVRSHPHLLDILTAIENDRQDEFARLLSRMVIDNAKLFATPLLMAEPLEEFVHFFSLSSNASLLLGGELKRREFLSGRYADILSCLVSGFAMEWHARHVPENMRPTEAFLVACRMKVLHELQEACNELIDNHPHSFVHRMLYMRKVGSRSRHRPCSDGTKADVVEELTTYDSSLRRLFKRDILTLHPTIRLIEEALEHPDRADVLRSEIIRTDVYSLDADGASIFDDDGAAATVGAAQTRGCVTKQD